jgi:hypothetical protein
MSDASVDYAAESEQYCKQFFDLVVACGADDWKEIKKFEEVCIRALCAGVSNSTG